VAPRRFARIDALLLLMTVIWGTNYSIVKGAFREIDPQAFNAIRMIIASAVFLAVIFGRRLLPSPGKAATVVAQPHGAADGRGDATASDRRLASIFYTPARITRRDWLGLTALGLVGHTLYQYCFIAGLARTSVANSSLLLAATPVIIAIVTAVLGLDRVGRLHWFGAGLSIAGIYVIVGRGANLGGSSITGDLLMSAAVCCWALFTIGARQLMERHSPVGVTGLSMAIGTLVYVPAVSGHLRGVDWGAVTRSTWIALVYSALFALCVAYTIWYAAVRAIGSARTAVYSNLVPLVAMATAALVLREPVSPQKLAGAAAVLVGVALTRVRRYQNQT
jgi:drug/metabolite transporter (DMT)-like permease